MKTVEVAPTVAFRLTDRLSLGASLLAQYAHVRLSSALDLGAICELNVGTLGAPPGSCAALGLPVQTVDGFVRIKGDSWGFGAHVGLLWEASPRTRVGCRTADGASRVDGTAEFVLPARADPAPTGALRPTGSRFAFDLPDVVRLGLPRADARWPSWRGSRGRTGRFREVVFRFDNPRNRRSCSPSAGRTGTATPSASRGVSATLDGPARRRVRRDARAERAAPHARIPDSDRV
jgi:hypothetical protein